MDVRSWIFLPQTPLGYRGGPIPTTVYKGLETFYGYLYGCPFAPGDLEDFGRLLSVLFPGGLEASNIWRAFKEQEPMMPLDGNGRLDLTKQKGR